MRSICAPHFVQVRAVGLASLAYLAEVASTAHARLQYFRNGESSGMDWEQMTQLPWSSTVHLTTESLVDP